MGQHTEIAWCDSTFNPWRGCTRVSEACRFCYAETMSQRNPAVLGRWGPGGTRVVASEAQWQQPLKWDRDAAKAGRRRRVFCASLADVFEDWRGPMVDAKGGPIYLVDLDRWPGSGGGIAWESDPLIKIGRDRRALAMDDVRLRLFTLIASTRHLDWLLLTKRPEFARAWLSRLSFDCTGDCRPFARIDIPGTWDEDPLSNCWLGTTCEDQATADERIPHLLRTPAAVRFLSCEPLLGPVDLTAIGEGDQRGLNALTGEFRYYREDDGEPSSDWGSAIDWVIVGGESGPKARPMHPQWARSIRDQCQAAGVAFHFKQHGEWFPTDQYDHDTELPRLGGRPEIYVGLQGQVVKTSSPFDHGCPCCVPPGYVSMVRVGKRAAGRLLDGKAWDEFPTPREANPCP